MAIIEFRFFLPAPSIHEMSDPEILDERAAKVEYIPPIDKKNVTPKGIISTVYELSVREEEGKIVGEIRKTPTHKGSHARVKLRSSGGELSIDPEKEMFFLDATANGVPFFAISEYNPPEEPKIRSIFFYQDEHREDKE